MIIEALNEKFEIIHIDQIQEEYRILHCRTPEQQEYTILHFKENGLVRTLLPRFDSLRDNVAYEDYKGCFSREEELYVVFYKRTGIPFTQFLLTQKEMLEQRIQIGKSVLEKILLWKLPDFMIVQLLDAKRILVQGEDVHFIYDWDVSLDERPDMSVINQRMAQLLGVLFQEEIANSVSPHLLKLLDHLEQDIPKDFFAIYEEYSSMHDIMPEEAQEYVSGIQKVKKRAKQTITKLSGYVKIALFVAGYVAAVWLLLNEIKERNAEEQETEGVIYEAIGGLKIKSEK